MKERYNIDHVTPKAVHKVWLDHGLAMQDVNRDENLQIIRVEDHVRKDRDTPLRKEVLRQQLEGRTFTFEEHRTIFERGRIST